MSAETATIIDVDGDVGTIKIVRGQGFTFLGQITSAGVPQPLTNYGWELYVKHPRSGNTELALTLGDGIEIEPATSDEQVRFTIDQSDTTGWVCAQYDLHIFFTTPPPQSLRYPALIGKINVKQV